MARPELQVGQAFAGRRMRVDGKDMQIFSLLMSDPNPLHFDPEAVRRRGLGERRINQGTINMAYPINALLELVGEPRRIRAFRCRLLGNVFEGDQMSAVGAVTSVDGSRAVVEIWLERENGDRVLEGSATLDVAGDQ